MSRPMWPTASVVVCTAVLLKIKTERVLNPEMGCISLNLLNIEIIADVYIQS